MNFTCTWIYLDSPSESSEYPQVGKNSHLLDFQKIYWKCVAVFFASSIQFNPDSRRVLFSNKKLAEMPQIEGFDIGTFLSENNVDVVTIPLTWQTPEGYFGKWRNQFYIFDVLKYIAERYNDDDQFLILDSDCLINRSLTDLFDSITEYGLLTLPMMQYTDKANINGVTREDMRTIYAEMDGKDPGHNPVYYGGEVFAATVAVIKQINRIVPDLWDNMLERNRNGQKKLNEEAHFLSYCYDKIGRFGTLEGFIKRIWTSSDFNNVNPSDVDLPIWHLPSEKKGGIALLFKRFTAKGKPLPEHNLGEYVGVSGRKYYLNLKHFLRHTRLYQLLKRR